MLHRGGFSDIITYVIEEIAHGKNAKYANGKITFDVPAENVTQVVDDLSSDSLEDGLYAGMPGEGLVYPTKSGNEELGVIDYRKTITY